MNSKLTTLIAVLLLAVAFVAINMAAGPTLRGARADLTEGALYTLTGATKRIVRGLEEPITLKYYFSRSVAAEQPQLLQAGQRVEELLLEYERLSRGGDGAQIRVEIIDPEPFSEAEDDATAQGIVAAPLGGRSFYFGLVGTNSTTGREVLPSFAGIDERFLEYELSRTVQALTRESKPVLGFITDLPVNGLPQMPGVPPELMAPWQITSVLGQFFDIRRIQSNDEQLPADLDALLIVHAKDMPESLLYSIDQYVLAGGPTVAFVDPIAETDIPLEALQNPQALMTADRTSDLGPLLAAYGVQFNPGVIVGDLDTAQQVRDQRNPGQAVRFLPYLNLQSANLNQEQSATGQLSNLTFGTAGELTLTPDSTTELLPLAFTSEQSQLISVEDVRFGADPAALLQAFAPSGVPRTVAVLARGQFNSAFPDGDPSSAAEDEMPTETAEPEPETESDDHIAQAAEPVTIAVIADADMLADRFWIQPQRLLGQTIGYQRLAQNGDFMLNLLEALAGGELAEVRARGKLQRPFTLVQRIASDAEARYREREEQLEESIRQTQQRIAELQNQRSPDDPGLLLSPEQQDEIQRFQTELAGARRELRQVRFELNKDVESLGARIKFVNIALIPALVALAAVTLGIARRVGRRAA